LKLSFSSCGDRT